MKKAGLLRIGAMLAVLAVVMGAFVALPYWNARAQTTVWGLVDESGASPPNFLAGAPDDNDGPRWRLLVLAPGRELLPPVRDRGLLRGGDSPLPVRRKRRTGR